MCARHALMDKRNNHMTLPYIHIHKHMHMYVYTQTHNIPMREGGREAVVETEKSVKGRADKPHAKMTTSLTCVSSLQSSCLISLKSRLSLQLSFCPSQLPFLTEPSLYPIVPLTQTIIFNPLFIFLLIIMQI